MGVKGGEWELRNVSCVPAIKWRVKDSSFLPSHFHHFPLKSELIRINIHGILYSIILIMCTLKINLCHLITHQGFLSGSCVKNSLANAEDEHLTPGSGRSPREGNGNPVQYSCLGNPMDRGVWWATVHGVAKELART